MADWKTYAKAARNTVRKQAPEARDAAGRASSRAGDYVRAAGRALEEGRRQDPRPEHEERAGSPHPGERDAPREREARTGGGEHAERAGGSEHPRSEGSRPRTATAERPAFDGDRLRRDAAAYYTVASRRASAANIVPRIMRALRDALLIGLSLLIIWGVLAAAGIPIPFTTVLIIVGVIVVISFASGVYAQSKRARAAQEHDHSPHD